MSKKRFEYHVKAENVGGCAGAFVGTLGGLGIGWVFLGFLQGLGLAVLGFLGGILVGVGLDAKTGRLKKTVKTGTTRDPGEPPHETPVQKFHVRPSDVKFCPSCGVLIGVPDVREPADAPACLDYHCRVCGCHYARWPKNEKP